MANYKYITRNQANIIYSNWKNGIIVCDKKFVDKVYQFVGRQTDNRDDIKFIYDVSDIVKFIIEGQPDLAQAIIDGKTISKEQVIVDEFTLTQEMIDADPKRFGRFKKPGDLIKVKEWKYVIFD